jgi:hypothetical protein
MSSSIVVFIIVVCVSGARAILLPRSGSILSLLGIVNSCAWRWPLLWGNRTHGQRAATRHTDQ